MAEYIKVSTQKIKSDREAVVSELEGLANDIEELYEDMQALGQTWEGPAWQTFQAQVASDVENMKTINDKLTIFLEHMENAERQYEQCEDEVRQLVDSIRV